MLEPRLQLLSHLDFHHDIATKNESRHFQSIIFSAFILFILAATSVTIDHDDKKKVDVHFTRMHCGLKSFKKAN